MAKDYNSAKSNTSTSVKSDEQGAIKVRTFSDIDDGDHDKVSRSVRQSEDYAGPGMGSHHPPHVGTEVVISDRGDGGGRGTTGLKSTLRLMKSAFTLTTIIVLIAAGADVYKM